MPGKLNLGGKPMPAPLTIPIPLSFPAFPSLPLNTHTEKALSPRMSKRVWERQTVLEICVGMCVAVPSTCSGDNYQTQCYSNLSQVFFGSHGHLTAYPFCSYPSPSRAPIQAALCRSTKFIEHSSTHHCAEEYKVIRYQVCCKLCDLGLLKWLCSYSTLEKLERCKKDDEALVLRWKS